MTDKVFIMFLVCVLALFAVGLKTVHDRLETALNAKIAILSAQE